MKYVVVVAIVVAIVAMVIALQAGGGNTADIVPVVSGEGQFGSGDTHQVKPTDVRIRVRNSHLEIPPASWTVEVFNGKTTEATFQLEYRKPGEVWPGYEMPPAGVSGWITYSKQTITIPAKSIGRTVVTLTIPAKTPGDWCFWIVVSEVTGGNVVSEVGIWWLVEMR